MLEEKCLVDPVVLHTTTHASSLYWHGGGRSSFSVAALNSKFTFRFTRSIAFVCGFKGLMTLWCKVSCWIRAYVAGLAGSSNIRLGGLANQLLRCIGALNQVIWCWGLCPL